MQAEIDAVLRAWGNSYGIAVPVDVVRRLHAAPGSRMHVTLRFEPEPNDPDRLPRWDFGGDYDIDEILDGEH